jgi:hypothetical protein
MWRCASEQLQRQKAAHGVGCRNCLAAGQIAITDDPIKRHANQSRKKQIQSAEFRAERPRRQIECLDARTIGRSGLRSRGTLLVHAPRELGKPLLPQEVCHGGRRPGQAVLLQGLADVVNGKILFAELNDPLSGDVVRLDSGTLGLNKKDSLGILAKLMNQLVEAARGVAKTLSRCRTSQPLHEMSSQRLVLAVRRVAGTHKRLSQVH